MEMPETGPAVTKRQVTSAMYACGARPLNLAVSLTE